MKKIRVGIMPAAGIGKRLSNLPLTRILPKPLLPIINKPIMEYGIENMKRLGVEIVHIIVGSQNKLIKKYFGDGSEFGVDINYIFYICIIILHFLNVINFNYLNVIKKIVIIC